MNEATIVAIARETVWVIVKVSAPVLLVSLIVGLLITLFQTITSLQEQTLSFLPKFIAIMVMLVITGSWMLKEQVGFFENLMLAIPQYINVR
ncbi:MAG: flagellar biosynthesis protein FliQ [Lachnospiraceae bacterium]|jgi:flagellar biosynthetic protein FliQ|nr:flagellar biosynthesis protein FliQ [Lachnospiraceae bacterium]MEE3460441.1 flagellar biosynthesis protein FliQ [Lachnospiraceae bacterium]